jgi:hypothetical protein
MPNDTPSRSNDMHEPDEFVVALPHVSVIASRIEKLGPTCETVDSPTLNLALVKLRDLDRFTASLRRAAQTRVDQADKAWVLDIVNAPNPASTTPLDDLMFCLRYDFAVSCGGWIPSMGKNRIVHNVTGLPHIDGGAVRYPERAPAPTPVSELDLNRGSGVRVGVLDTGLYPHPALAGRYLSAPADLLTEGTVYTHFAGHAAFVSGLILRRAPAAELDVRQTLRTARATTTLWDLVRRMMTFRGSGVRILNLSLGCYTADGQPPMALARAVRLLSPDIVIVAAAGNHGDRAENAESDHPDVTPRTAFWPAAMDDVVAVGADRGAGAEGPRLAPFSPRLPWVTVTADGVDVVSTYLSGDVDVLTRAGSQRRRFDGYARWSGTSFAAATVTGELAALARPGVSAWQAVAELKERARLKPDGPVRLFTG